MKREIKKQTILKKKRNVQIFYLDFSKSYTSNVRSKVNTAWGAIIKFVK